MTSAKRFPPYQLPRNGNLGFVANHQFTDWRKPARVDSCREFVTEKIVDALSKISSEAFAEEIHKIAKRMAEEVFEDALSEEDYMDKNKLLVRIETLVDKHWSQMKAENQQPLNCATPLSGDGYPPTSGMLKYHYGANTSRVISQYANSVSNLVSPDDMGPLFPSGDMPKESLRGSRKRKFNAASQLLEHSQPVYTAHKEGFSRVEPGDSGPTCSGSVLQYDSEASSESHRQRSGCYGEGAIGLNGESPPSVHMPRVSPICHEMHVPCPLAECQQFEGQICKPGQILDRSCVSKLESTMQNKNAHTDWDGADRGPAHSGLKLSSHHSLRVSFGASAKTCNITPYSTEVLKLPTKIRKLNASSLRCRSSHDVSGVPLGLARTSVSLDGEVHSGSPMMCTSDIPDSSMHIFTSQVGGPTKFTKTGDRFVDDVLRSNYGAASHAEDPSADEDLDPAAPNELKDKGHSKLLSDSVPSLCEGFNVVPTKMALPVDDVKEAESKESVEETPSSIATLTQSKSVKQKLEGVSVIYSLNAEIIGQHLSGLRTTDQGVAEEINVTTSNHSKENCCQLCTLEKLVFPPMPIYCSSCGLRIKNNNSYYSTLDDKQAPYCFCTTCYHRYRVGNTTSRPFCISKNTLKARKNDEGTTEPWVQCDRCREWQHQICGLYNVKNDWGDKAFYICPKCLEDPEFTEGKILFSSASWDASELSRTKLSDHLEQRLYRRLKHESEERAKATGKHPEKVPQPSDLVVRVVSSVDKHLNVKQEFLDVFPEKNYPAEFPYRSKVILLFQRIEGVDVCLFAMYVQEFGSECSQPNQRCVYISYLDSVKYFRPEIKTSKGEALRTFVYHELLVGYLEYCKKRGFATCYIWACPPVKGEDYILYCHPESQKTPKPEKLRQWYQAMLKKATEEKIVVNFTNLYEKFFVVNVECNTKVTAARLPYFDGDYWSGVAEHMIKKIELETGGDPEKQIKKMTRRSLKAMGHTNPSAHEAKDILLMAELSKSIGSSKDDFIIVYLQSVCTHCHEVILSGTRWFCKLCKNYQLCERCHENDQCATGLGETHISSTGQKHALYQEMVDDVPVDTEDHDAIIDNCFLENRHAFLNFCQGNHYQFDSLRRAKHSSMMILYHLHRPNGSKVGAICSLCLKNIGSHSKWTCQLCPDFIVCDKCHQISNSTCHSHTLDCHPSSVMALRVKAANMAKELMGVLLHASQCETCPCSYPHCTLLKRLFAHARNCSIRVSGGCPQCKKAWWALMVHAHWCQDSHCRVPRCIEVKERARRCIMQSKARQGKVLQDASRQPIL